MKRLFDLLFSLGALLFFSPLLLAVSLLVKLVSRGPIFFTQERIGLHGKPFKIYKIRTMHEDAEERLDELLNSSMALKQEWEERQKLKRDPRVLPFGGFLRATSLDELPQFWNVLKGEMSVVGPRPVTERELALHYRGYRQKVLSVKPGLTGLWQISGRSSTSYKKRVSLDVHYVKHQNLTWDILLCIRTVPEMLFPKGAF